MEQLPISIIVDIAVLTLFLSFITALRFAIRSNFVRTRLIMTSFFVFIVVMLSVSFWRYALATLSFTIPVMFFGIFIGHVVGVRAAKEKLKTQGLEFYMEHFAHVHFHEVRSLSWWSLINFYSISGALLLINLAGLSNVIFHGSELGAIVTSIIGSFLIGTIVPYLFHLWSIRASADQS